MAELPTGGTISLLEIQTEFGGAKPIGISEYYRNGPHVPNLTTTSKIPVTATTKVPIDFNDFWNTSEVQTFDMGLLPNVNKDNADSSMFGSEQAADNAWVQRASENAFSKTITIPTVTQTNNVRLRSTSWKAKIGGGVNYYDDAYSNWTRYDNIRDPALAVYNGTYGSGAQGQTDTNNQIKRTGAGNDKIWTSGSEKTISVPALSNVTVIEGKKYTIRYSVEIRRVTNSGDVSPGNFKFDSNVRPRIYVDTI